MMKDFIKKHTHAIINVFGIILTVLFAIPSGISFYALLLFVIVAKYPFILLLLLISNIIAYKADPKNEKVLAVICSALFGSIGGFISVNNRESDVSAKRTISIIFNIQMWLIAMSAVGFFSGLYYAGSHF